MSQIAYSMLFIPFFFSFLDGESAIQIAFLSIDFVQKLNVLKIFQRNEI